MGDINEKYQKLQDILQELKKVTVAFSGGVDSTFLLKAAKQILGEQVLAVTVSSCLFPEREQAEARAFCEKEGIPFLLCPVDELGIEGFSENPPNRCYLCKKDLFQRISNIAREHGMSAVIEGSNMDDTNDYRPGMAAVKELGIRSPLQEAGLTKAEIRQLSKELKLDTWDKPGFACLASRFVYGEKITKEKLHMVDTAEQMLLDLGFRQMRVRIHGNMARLEILPEEFEKILQKNNRQMIYDRLKELGFTYVTLDMGGYRSGSMNESLVTVQPSAAHSDEQLEASI